MTLDIHGLAIDYDGHRLLDDIHFAVPDGRSAFLLGPSGSGKTSILRCIAGLQRPEAGSVSVAGQRLDDVPTHRRRVGMLFQEPALFPHLDAAQNVAFGLRYRDVPRNERHEEALRWLGLVGLADRANQSVDTLSGGQRQRVALARTLAAKPRAVLLDEPFSALDAALRLELGARVKQLLAKQGVPALWVTHDEAEAERLADLGWRIQGTGLVPMAKPQE